MIAGGIGIVIGLIVLFFGMALLEQERKDNKKRKEAKEKQIAEAAQEADLVSAIVDAEDQPAFTNIRRDKLGAFLVAQGVLVAIVGMAFVLVCRFFIDIKWYIIAPVLVIILILSFMVDAYMMGGFGLGEIPSEDAPVDEEEQQEVADCTDNSPTAGDIDSEE